jgi:hypothetical protein
MCKNLIWTDPLQVDNNVLLSKYLMTKSDEWLYIISISIIILYKSENCGLSYHITEIILAGIFLKLLITIGTYLKILKQCNWRALFLYKL